MERHSVPAAIREASPHAEQFEALAGLVARGDLVVLSGAGLSTESGIPDYRGPDGKRRVTPMTYGEFVASADNRRRYWARSYVGWRRFAAAAPERRPPGGGRAAAAGARCAAVITQNVDGLHQAGGRARRARAARQPRPGRLPELRRAARRGPTWMPGCARRTRASRWWPGEIRPDGDVVLPEEAVQGFHPPRCLVLRQRPASSRTSCSSASRCRKPLVERCFELVERSRGLLVLGSSLQVMSGYRFVRRAAALSLPVAIVTRGATRGDEQATIRLDAPLGRTLTRLVAELDPAAVARAPR